MSNETPFQVVSSFDHLVTQWMSTFSSVAGNASSSVQLQRNISRRFGSSSTSDQFARFTCGVGPADSTGKSGVRYCPGGTRACSLAPSRRLPRNPRVTAMGAA